MTVGNCVSGCRAQEYEYAAVQFAYLCFCGDHYGRFGKLPDEMCDSTCKSPGDQYCGGDWKNSIYATGQLLPMMHWADQALFEMLEIVSMIELVLFYFQDTKGRKRSIKNVIKSSSLKVLKR